MRPSTSPFLWSLLFTFTRPSICWKTSLYQWNSTSAKPQLNFLSKTTTRRLPHANWLRMSILTTKRLRNLSYGLRRCKKLWRRSSRQLTPKCLVNVLPHRRDNFNKTEVSMTQSTVAILAIRKTMLNVPHLILSNVFLNTERNGFDTLQLVRRLLDKNALLKKSFPKNRMLH